MGGRGDELRLDRLKIHPLTDTAFDVANTVHAGAEGWFVLCGAAEKTQLVEAAAH